MNAWIRIFLSLSIGFFFLYWICQHVSLIDLRDLSSKIDLQFMLMGIGCYFLGSLMRTWRWRKLLQPFIFLKFTQVFSALIVGSAMNLILPARLGEVVRIDLCKKWYGLSRSTALVTILWERVADGMTVVLCLLVGMLSLDSVYAYREIKGLVWIGGGIFASIALTLFFLSKNSISCHRFPKLQGKIETFQKDVQKMSASTMGFLVVMSMAVWAFEGLSMWYMVRGIGRDLGFLSACLLIGVVSLSTLLPSPPGFLGTLQFAFSLVLQIIGYPIAFGIFCATLYQIFIGGSLVIVGLSVWAWVAWRQKIAKMPESPREPG